MAYAGWTAVIQDDRGNIQPGATVEVRNINTGSLAVLYSDRMGTVGLGNPFQADSEGYATFFAKGAEYRITATRGAWTTEWPYVPVGTTQGVDLADLALGLDYDAQVNTLPERDAYDGEPEGFSVLVSDVGDGRGAVYTRTDVPGEWSDPAFITGVPGPATNISIGTVDTVDYGEGSSATMTGASPAQVLNLELERGAPGRIDSFQGPWSGSVTYASGDIVESGGSLYMAMVADPAATPPSTGWELFLPGSSVADGTVTIAKTDGTYARVTFDTVAQLLTGVVAGKELSYDPGAGKIVVVPGEHVAAQGFRYEVAASAEPTADLETAGELKLNVLKFGSGVVPAEAFGASPDGETDNTVSIQKALDSGETVDFGGQGNGFAIGELLLEDGKEYHLIGSGAHLIRLDGVNAPMVFNGGTTFVEKLTMTGLVIDGNWQGQTEFSDTFFGHFRYVDIDRCAFVNGLGSVLSLMHVAEYGSVTRCLFSDAMEHSGVRNESTNYLVLRTAGDRAISDHQHINISGNYFKGFIPVIAGGGVGGIIAQSNSSEAGPSNSHKLTISDNTFDTIGQDTVTEHRVAPINLYRRGSQSIIRGNRILRPLHPAIDVQGSDSVIVSDNLIICEDTRVNGVSIAPRDEGTALPKPCTDIITANNIIKGSSIGIRVISVPGTKNKNVFLLGNDIQDSQQAIYIRDVEGELTVHGNVINGTSETSSAPERQAIGIMGDSTGASSRSVATVSVKDNIVKATANKAIQITRINGQIDVDGNLIDQPSGVGIILTGNDGTAKIGNNSVNDVQSAATSGSLITLSTHGGDVLVNSNDLRGTESQIRGVQFTNVDGDILFNGNIVKDAVNHVLNFDGVTGTALVSDNILPAGATIRSVNGSTVVTDSNIGTS